VKVRSTRAPRPAWLSRGAHGIEVELADSEEGVAPGQACVFYESGEGQARVLGGGFIRSTVAREPKVRPIASETLLAARG
jgi:tRNA-specific 2-thiouridylase